MPRITPASLQRRSLSGRPSLGEPSPVDIHIGARLRARRQLLGFSLEKTGRALGITFQQVQKYELGAVRISASRLWDLSAFLNCPVGDFFTGAGGVGAEPLRPDPSSHAVPPLPFPDLVREWVQYYYAIPTPAVRRELNALVKHIADSAPRGEEP